MSISDIDTVSRKQSTGEITKEGASHPSGKGKRRVWDAKGKGWHKEAVLYLLLSLFAVFVDNIYAYFGHGVRSHSMTFMFLYPLLGGSFLYFLIDVVMPDVKRKRGYRLFLNLYNAGIATLTTGSFLNGILEIAGTGSPFTILFFITGWIFSGTGILILVYITSKK